MVVSILQHDFETEMRTEMRTEINLDESDPCYGCKHAIKNNDLPYFRRRFNCTNKARIDEELKMSEFFLNLFHEKNESEYLIKARCHTDIATCLASDLDVLGYTEAVDTCVVCPFYEK